MERRRAFTFVELLVVVGIIALLVTILMPTVNRIRNQARAAVCCNNLSQLAKGAMGFANDHNQVLPAHKMDDAATRWWGYDPQGRASTDDDEGPQDIWDHVGKRREVFRCPALSGGEGAAGGVAFEWHFNALDVGYGYNAWFLGWHPDGGAGATQPTLISGITPKRSCRLSYIKNASMTIIFADSTRRGSSGRGGSFAMWWPVAASGQAGVYGRHSEQACVAFVDTTARPFAAEDINPPGDGSLTHIRYWDPRQGE